jgi:uncharacterized SAM-dependent methyltransferase
MGVSPRAVRNWIDAALAGKLDLTLYEEDGKQRIANTTKNLRIMEELVERGKKSRNTRYQSKLLVPASKFYDLYSPKQVVDIISNLEIHRELPLQYSYFDGGAEYWDTYAFKLLNEPAPNILSSTIRLLDLSHEYIVDLLGDYERVNVIDLGPGNGLPVRELLAHLLERKVLGRYIAIDLSKPLLAIAQRNIESWFGSDVPFEAHVRDITGDRFDDILVKEFFGEAANKTVNLVLLFGGTLLNQRLPAEVLQVIRRSMGRNDLLLYNTKLDTPNARQYFDFNAMDNPEPLALNHRLMLDLLGVSEDTYEVERKFDEHQMSRTISARLTVDVSIQFELEHGLRIVDLKKGEAITLWRARHLSAAEVVSEFNDNDFNVLHTSKTRDNEYLLAVCEVKAEN